MPYATSRTTSEENAELAVVEVEQLAVGEQVEGDVEVEGVGPARREGAYGVDGPLRADDRAVLEHVALGGAERVEPRRDETRAGSRAGRAGERATGGAGAARLAQERDELLEEERVAAAALEQQGEHRRRRRRPSSSSSELAGRVGVERLEVSRAGVVAARSAAASAPRARGGRWRPARTARSRQRSSEPVDQVEHEVVGPVQVGQHEHHRPSRARALEERQHRAQRVVASPARVDRRAAAAS